MGQPEAAADEAAVGKDLFHLVGVSRGADIEILGPVPQEQVPDTSAHQVGDVSVAMKSVQDLQGIRVDQGAGQTVFGTGNDVGLRERCGILR